MEAKSESRADRKRRLLLVAATALFLEKGYDGTSMDDVAAKANVSKPTVYKYFSDKEQLFAEIVRATTNEIDNLVRLVVETMAGHADIDIGLTVLARRFITALMRPRVLRLRRLVIANADRFPDVGRRWYGRKPATRHRVRRPSYSSCSSPFLRRRRTQPVRAAN